MKKFSVKLGLEMNDKRGGGQKPIRVGFEFTGIKYSAPYTLRINKTIF